jgi:molybdopterin molybdotransferase
MEQPLLSYSEAVDCVRRSIAAFPGAQIGFEPSVPSTAMSGEELVPLAEAAGRVLAQAIAADRDQPPFPRSTRDGFACRADEANTHEFLFRGGAIRAGQASGILATGDVWEIMTGAPVPTGADAVFMVEYADRHSNFVRLTPSRTVCTGENIVPQGAEARAGDLLIPPGVRLGAAQIALAAQCGYAQLAVSRRPKVAILSTGDELVSVESSPGPSQIRNSNSPMLAALVAAVGGEPMVLATVPDQEAAIDAAISSSLSSDLLLISGGISAGRFDLVEDALIRAGARFFFRGVAIQPGKPVAFGQLPRPDSPPIPFFALPGNPISSAVTFQLFAAPVLAALAGDSSPEPKFALAQLAREWRGKTGLTRFLPAWCDFAAARAPQVRLIPWQGSGDLAAFARSNCCLFVSAETEEIPEGSTVQILLT